MKADENLMRLYEAGPAIELEDESCSFLLDRNQVNNPRASDDIVNRISVSVTPIQSDGNPNSLVPSTAHDSPEDYDFSDVVLKYIDQMLMEDDIEEKACTFQQSAALQAAERSFYEVIGEKYPPPIKHEKPSDEQYAREHSSVCHGGNDGYGGFLCPNGNHDLTKDDVLHDLRSTSRSSHSSSGTVTDVPADNSPVSTLGIPGIFSDSESIMQFKKGVEEASKFLPKGNSLLLDVRYKVVWKEQNEERKGAVVEVEKNMDYPEGSSRRKRNTYHEEVDLTERRNNKQSAVFFDPTVRSEMFDRVLLSSKGKNESAIREALQALSIRNALENGLSNDSKSRGKKKGVKRDVVDLEALLTHCAQAVAASNRTRANEFLKEIRQNSSPVGDGMQRLAHYFANGLEARMAGSGTHIYKAIIMRPVSAANVLKAYQVHLACVPLRKISNFFSNKTIMNVAEKASTVHVIDYGIMWGFQWPCLIHRLSSRPGGPPKLRITGIDFPNPGFRPAERVEETGKRLANYAESFGVPFEFNAIAQKWETVKLEDLKIHKGEVLVVNCLYRFRNLLDETVGANSPRDVVLNFIRRLNPDVFIHGIVNGGYNGPFFIRRFREALFHYSSLFDILEATIPREVHERELIERDILSREAMNVIACEGAERIERPETYKQWQVRLMETGLRSLPLDKELMRILKEQMKAYNKNFDIDVDGDWVLQGWKGRIGYALSTWKAAC